MTDLVANDADARKSSFTVLNRVIPVAPLSTLDEGQVLGFMKIFRRYTMGTADAALMVKLDQALSKLLDPADNDWLDYQIMEGNAKWTDVLLAMMPCLRGTDTSEEQTVVSPKKAVAKKAATKKAAPKKAAKKAVKRA